MGQSVEGLTTLKTVLDEYQAKYRRPDFRLEMSGLYSLFPQEEVSDDPLPVANRWPDTFPHNGRQGVYIIFGKNRQTPLYVGKASMSHSIGGRLSDYFCYE